MYLISIIIPTYNPNILRLNRTIQGVIDQSVSNWECIIINNNSSQPFETKIIKHPQLKVVQQPKQGLTYARLKGISEAKHDIIVMVDDDNVLDVNYLYHVQSIFNQYPLIGAIGGKSLPIFESAPPSYLKEFYGLLALRDLGEKINIESFNHQYPKYAPIGAGMAFRKVAIKPYTEKIENGNSIISDRKGNSLSSSGDNDMVYEIVKNGWQVGYFPQLSLQHIIPMERMQVAYLARLNFGIQKSWVQFLTSQHICPWKKITKATLPLRKFKAYITYRAWKNNVNFIKYKGACGMFEGLAK